MNDKVCILNSSFNHIKSINIHRPLGIEVDIENKLYICSDNIKIYNNNKYINSIDIECPEYLCFHKNNLITINNNGVCYKDKQILEYSGNSFTKFIGSYNNKLCISRFDTNKVIEYEIIEER